MRINENWRQEGPNTAHYVEGRLLDVEVFSDRYFFKNVHWEEKKLRWGKFTVQLNGEKDTTTLTFSHQAFDYFKLDFHESKNWQWGRKILEEYFEDRANVDAKVRMLIKNYSISGSVRHKVMYLEPIDKFTK